MDFLKQETELFHPFPVIRSKNFSNKRIFIRSKDSKIDFRNRKWNYPNRKRNYFTPFQSLNQKTSLTKVFPLGPRILKLISETGNGIIQTGNGIISPFSGHWIKKLLLQKYPHMVQRFHYWFQKQKMELSKQEMELFLAFPVIGSQIFINKIIPQWFRNATKDFRNRKQNYQNRR